MHRGTSAWQPNRRYTPDIKQGLAILATEEPEEVHYFRSRGYPVSFVPGIPGTMAQTTPSGVIRIPSRFEGQSAQLAVILSHEIVHEQRHDPFTNPARYSVLRRLLWHQEEEVAHNKDLSVAYRLRNRYPSVWNILGRGWIWETLIYWMLGPFFLLDVCCLLLLAYSSRKGLFRSFVSHPTERQLV